MHTVPLPLFDDNESGIARIPLTQGMVALIDARDEAQVRQFTWIASKSANAFYARASMGSAIPGLQMHRFILDAPKGVQVDHLNGNTLDNRRCNIELVDGAENMRRWAQRAIPNKASRFTGVYWNRRSKCWYVRIHHGGRNLHIGIYRDEIEAAIAYDDACEDARGYRVNFPQ